MKEFLILHKDLDGTEILIRTSAVHDLSNFNGKTAVGLGGDVDNYYLVKESYDEVKEMLLDGRDQESC